MIRTVTAHSIGLFVDRGRSLNLLLLDIPCLDILAVVRNGCLFDGLGTLLYNRQAVLVRCIRGIAM